MTGERKGLTRSGRKIVTRYRNGFTKENKENNTEDVSILDGIIEEI